MNDNLFIKGDDGANRFLDSSETFCKKINMNVNLPEVRQFKNGECITTDKDNTAYSIGELINLLNYFNHCTVNKIEYAELESKIKQLKSQIRVFEVFLKENNLDIEWDEFCIKDKCFIQSDEDYIPCQKCDYMDYDLSGGDV